jgi:hypothetical protein
MLSNFEIYNFSFKPMEYDKHLAITYFINILIWTINLFWARYKFCKNCRTRRPSVSNVPK